MSSKRNLQPDNFGARLQNYRLEKKLTGKQLADIIGISQGSLSELENGKREPSGKVFFGIAENTDIDLKWLLTGKSRKLRKCQEISAARKFEIFDQAEEWLNEEVKKNPKREIWFEVEFEKAFQEFKAWKEEKDRMENEEAETQTYKVA